MAFWEQHVEELALSIDALLGQPAAAASTGVDAVSGAHGLPCSEGTETPPPLPGEVAGAGWSGPGSEDARAAGARLHAEQSARWESDRVVEEHLRAVHEADAATRRRLHAIRHDLAAGVAALRSSADTPAGEAQMAGFLRSKTVELRQLVDEAQSAASSRAGALGDVVNGYDA